MDSLHISYLQWFQIIIYFSEDTINAILERPRLFLSRQKFSPAVCSKSQQLKVIWKMTIVSKGTYE